MHKNNDIGVGIGTVVVSILLFWELMQNEARQMGMSAVTTRTYPLVATGILFAFGCALTVRAVALLRRADVTSSEPGPVRFWSRDVGVVIGSIITAAMLVRPLGFYPVVGVFVSFLTGYLDRWRHPVRVALVTAGALLGFFLVFTAWLQLLLPRGRWW